MFLTSSMGEAYWFRSCNYCAAMYSDVGYAFCAGCSKTTDRRNWLMGYPFVKTLFVALLRILTCEKESRKCTHNKNLKKFLYPKNNWRDAGAFLKKNCVMIDGLASGLSLINLAEQFDTRCLILFSTNVIVASCDPNFNNFMIVPPVCMFVLGLIRQFKLDLFILSKFIIFRRIYLTHLPK